MLSADARRLLSAICAFVAFCTSTACVLPDGTEAYPTASNSNSSSSNADDDDEEEAGTGISAFTSTITVSESIISVGGESVFTLQAKDTEGNDITEGGDTVGFKISGGTSSGTISETTDNGDGTYTATFTGETGGTAVAVLGTVKGIPTTTTPGALQVIQVDYYRALTLSAATTEDNEVVKVVLNTGNFTYANASSSGDDIRFYDSNDENLDYYIEHYDTSDESVIWVRVNNAGETDLEMTYGSAFLPAASTETIFQHETPRDLYVTLSRYHDTILPDVNIASFMDNNSITVEDTGGTTNLSLDQYDFTAFSNVIQGVIQANGAITGRALDAARTFDELAPLVFQNTLTGFPASQAATDRWDFYNPNASVANITIRSYDAAGVETGSYNDVVPAQDFFITGYDVDTFGVVESDVPVLTFYHKDTNLDGVNLLPRDTELYGVASNSAFIGILEDGTSGTIYYSDGSSSAFAGNKGERVALNAAGNQGGSQSARIVSNLGVVAIAQNDGDGGEATSFYPRDELNNSYIIPTISQYVAISCPYSSSITVYNPDDSQLYNGNCTPPGPDYPGFAFFGDAGATLPISAGSYIISDAPIFAYYEYNVHDETNLNGIKQARVYTASSPTVSVGAEQSF